MRQQHPEFHKSFLNMEYLDSSKFLSILYHDIFDYPLTKEELERWEFALQDGGNFPVQKTGKFYHVPGRRGTVLKRLGRKNFNRMKQEVAQVATKKIALIPTVKMVGITGALAMNNAKEADDIDLLIVTSAGSLWTTRFLVVGLIDSLRIARRRPGKKETADRLCLNLWLDEDNLEIKDRNIYTAHEIAQVVPLVNKGKTYEKLIQKNAWFTRFWPKAAEVKKLEIFDKKQTNPLISLIEPIARSFQLWYMRPKRTCEIVDTSQAFFHPVDWQGPVLSAFDKRLTQHSFFVPEKLVSFRV